MATDQLTEQTITNFWIENIYVNNQWLSNKNIYREIIQQHIFPSHNQHQHHCIVMNLYSICRCIIYMYVINCSLCFPFLLFFPFPLMTNDLYGKYARRDCYRMERNYEIGSKGSALVCLRVCVCVCICVSVKVSQDRYLVNTHILIYRQASCDCKLWNVLSFYCIFLDFSYIIDEYSCLKCVCVYD